MQFLFAAVENPTETAQASGNILTSLGIDWRLFISQTIAFVILLAILTKFVYPPLIKSIDKRRETIEAGLNEAKEAQKALAEAEKRATSLLAEARQEADDIVARGHAESSAMLSEAEAKAKQRAERIVKEARDQLQADVVKARASLKKDTMQLVALATEKIISEKLDDTKDAQLVARAIAAQERA